MSSLKERKKERKIESLFSQRQRINIFTILSHAVEYRYGFKLQEDRVRGFKEGLMLRGTARIGMELCKPCFSPRGPRKPRGPTPRRLLSNTGLYHIEYSTVLGGDYFNQVLFYYSSVKVRLGWERQQKKKKKLFRTYRYRSIICVHFYWAI